MKDTRKYALVRTIAPATEPVTLAEAKLYLRVDGSAEDTLISDMIVVARMEAEQFLRRALITQTWKLAYDDYLPEQVILPMTPVIEISSVAMVDRGGSSQLVDSDVYFLNAANDVLTLDTVLFSHRIEVVFTAGYGNAADVPSPIKHGMLSHIATMYDLRGIYNTGIPEMAQRLYMPFREVRL